ncbi:S41 family peptidase [Ningiella sp. W23]|uniref:S41 family peptidase n=1 Tax=Ningiella sp. W23 TaxID=3023715 RepID=UPI00375788B9
MNGRIASKSTMHAVFIVFACFLMACGGGGSNSSSVPARPNPAPSPNPVPSQPQWTFGVYESASNFAARCESPRSGIDPISGNAYPDTAGSALEEKLWMRSFSNETYLWFDEVPDNDPNDFTIPAYFAQLKTTELTASGKPKDSFHFSEDTASYNERTQSGTSSGYGIRWEFVANHAPRELIVRYTEPGSPAEQAGIPRGASVKVVDGIDFVNTEVQDDVDAINAALFPEADGSEHTFEFELIDGSRLTATLLSGVISIQSVQNTRILDTEVGRVGYFQFNSFITPSQSDLIDAFHSFVDESVTELVIDLRYNGGGSLNLAAQIAYMVAGPNQTRNAAFNRLRLNGKREQPAPIPFWDSEIDYVSGVLLPNTLPSPELTRVFVITTESTCSASESVINGLRGIDVEVIQIGETTCGKPFGFVPEDNCGTTYFTIQSQGVNDKGFGDYIDGFVPVASPVFDDQLPGCEVRDDFTQPLGSQSEQMLSTALYYAANGECPAINAVQNAESRNTRENQDEGGSGPAIRTPNVYLDAILSDQYQPISKGGS